MFNVLTTNFKEHIRSQYNKRKIFVWLCVVICIQASFLILIVPSYVYLVSTTRDLQAELTNGQSKSNVTAPTADVFISTNNTLSILASGNNVITLAPLISKIVSLKGAGIQLTEIVYTTKTATSSTFVVHGTAVNRDSLLSFSKRLETDPVFNSVDLPVSNFAKDKNIEFSMNMNAQI